MTFYKQHILPKLAHSNDISLRLIDGRLRSFQSVLGAILLLIGVLVVTRKAQFPGWWALLPTLGAMLIISAGTQAWLNRIILSNRVLVWFGLISYPLYLWHWPLLSFARIIEGEMPSREVRIAAVVISIALAWLTYKLIEIPVRFGRRSGVKIVTLLLLMVLVGFVANMSLMEKI
jgi:peptidoglycan/LPS O-acetylase OafA/YrhL